MMARNCVQFLAGLKGRIITLESCGVVTSSCGTNYPRFLGCVFNQTFSNHVAGKTVNFYSGYDAYLKKRRRLQSCLRERKNSLPYQILRRKRDSIMPNIRAAKDKITIKMGKIVERENIWTIPNILCVGRILVCPYLGYLILQENYTVSCYLLAFAGITDFLDGFIARNFKGQSSKLGSFIDPLADKILIATVFLTLSYNGSVPLVLTTLIVTRDMALAAAGFYIRYQSLPPPKTLSRYFDPSHATTQLAPTLISKVNTFVQLATICATLSAPVLGYADSPYLVFLWWFTGFTTVLSAGSYIFSFDRYMGKVKGRKLS